MQLRKVALAAFLSVVAILAIAAGSASAALPEFTVLKDKFTATSESGVLETSGAAKVKVSCTSDTAEGETLTAKTVGNGKVTFKGCASGASKCTSSGAAEGEIKTNALAGEIGYTSASAKEVGLRLEPAAGKSSKFAEFKCGAKAIFVTNAVIGAIKPVNTKTTAFEYVLTQTKGVQTIKKFETGVEEVLLTTVEGGETAAKSGIQSTEKITATTAGEILA